MKVSIYSRKEMEALISRGEIENTAIISFYDPIGRGRRYLEDYAPIDFSGKSDRVVQIAIHDLDPEALSDFGLSVEAYFPEADTLAEFIYKAKEDELDIICQCEYGQSRSAGCAAAILEHFEHRGIDIFSDYKYYPNQLVYHKIYDALEKHVYDKAVNYIKTTPDYISVDNLQRKIGVGFGMARKIIDKLFSDGVIERSEDKNRESYKLSSGGDVK